jgi:hypothetical protein
VSARASAERGAPSNSPVEQSHLAEQAAVVEYCDHRLAAVARARRDRNPSVTHDEQLGRVVALAEDDVVARELALLRLVGQFRAHRLGERAEQRGGIEDAGHSRVMLGVTGAGAEMRSGAGTIVHPLHPPSR